MIKNLPLTNATLASEYRRKGFWQDQTIAERFFTAAEQAGDKTAIIINDSHISYKQLADDVRTVAANLLKLGLQAGDVVAGQLPNAAEIPLLHLACNTVGLLYMPLHDSWRETELSHLLNLAQVKVVIEPGVYRGFDYNAMFCGLKNHLKNLEVVFSLGGESNELRAFSDLLLITPDMPSVVNCYPDPDLPAALMLSGGTTAISKISRFSSNNMLAMLEPSASAANFTANDIAVALAPAGTGATGYIYPILMPLLTGATSVILPRWGDPAKAIELIKAHNCTYAVAIPAQLTKMVPALEIMAENAPKTLRCFANAGAPLPLQTAEKIEHYLSCRVQSIYGSTDGGVPTMTNLDDADEKRLGTVGRAVAYADLKICDEQGNTLSSGEIGEIVWQCADKSWGYLGADEQTAETFTDTGYYKSGDLGRIDGEGYLQITGRIKDMILRGGRNISPQTIEVPLQKHSAVLDVAVAAMPDPILGERACAFVILNPNATLTFEEMIVFLKQQDLAVWQLPEHLVILDDFPKGAGGKVKKAELTAMLSTPNNN